MNSNILKDSIKEYISHVDEKDKDFADDAFHDGWRAAIEKRNCGNCYNSEDFGDANLDCKKGIDNVLCPSGTRGNVTRDFSCKYWEDRVL